MFKNAHRALGEAMPSLNRRRLLLGLAAASAAAGVAPILAQAMSPAENPELVGLGEELPAIEAEMLDAKAAYFATLKEWQGRWPLAPDVIVKSYNDSNSWERDMLGQAMLPDRTYPEHGPHVKGAQLVNPRSLFTVADCHRFIGEIDRFVSRKRPKHPLTAEDRATFAAERVEWCARLDAAKAFEGAKADVLSRSNLSAVRERIERAEAKLAALSKRIMGERPETMDGLMIQALAMTALSKTRTPLLYVVETVSWQSSFAASVLRIAEQSAEREG